MNVYCYCCMRDCACVLTQKWSSLEEVILHGKSVVGLGINSIPCIRWVTASHWFWTLMCAEDSP